MGHRPEAKRLLLSKTFRRLVVQVLGFRQFMGERFGIPGHPASHHLKADIGGPHAHMTDMPTILVQLVAGHDCFLATQEIAKRVPGGPPVRLADLRRIAPGKANEQYLVFLRPESEGVAIRILDHRTGDLKGKVGLGLGLDSRLGNGQEEYRQPESQVVPIFCAVGQNRLCLKVLSVQLSGNPQAYPQVSGIAPHVRFDEGGVETGLRQGYLGTVRRKGRIRQTKPNATAPHLLYGRRPNCQVKFEIGDEIWLQSYIRPVGAGR